MYYSDLNNNLNSCLLLCNMCSNRKLSQRNFCHIHTDSFFFGGGGGGGVRHIPVLGIHSHLLNKSLHIIIYYTHYLQSTIRSSSRGCRVSASERGRGVPRVGLTQTVCACLHDSSGCGWSCNYRCCGSGGCGLGRGHCRGGRRGGKVRGKVERDG